MKIPFAYNFRNLVVRKTTTIMTALGIGLTVAVLLSVLALVNGLQTTLASSGDPLRVLVLRKGAESEVVSLFTRAQFQDLKFKPGIAAGKDGQPLASMEVVTVVNLSASEGVEGTNVTIRGLMPAGIEMRKNVRIVAGRWFDSGKQELVVGRHVADAHPEAALGKRIHLARGDWEIVGVMDSGEGGQASEIWGDLYQLSTDQNRTETGSSALVQAADAVTARALVADLNSDQRLNMNAMSEEEYFKTQNTQARPILYIGIFVAIIMAVGSSFAAMNTMYAAVARRAREIGTLRVLGFSRASILVSFFVESVVLAALGGLIGCLLVLPLNGITTGVGNANFAETNFNFRVSPELMLAGVIFAVVVGGLGGLFPARNASRKEILTALREV
jgi:putative ABC transport system permease protein